MYFRLMLRARERQPAEQKLRLIDEVRSITQQEFPHPLSDSEPQVTGFFVLLTSDPEHDPRSMDYVAIATMGIGLMMIVAFRSLVLAAVAIVPNAMPILLVLGPVGMSLACGSTWAPR